MDLKGEIRIRYKFVDGWHIFSSRDVRGLYVASKDAERAFRDVGPSIETLLRLSSGQRFKAEPLLPFDEFMRRARQPGQRAVPKSSPPSMTSQNYTVYPVAA